MSPRLDGREAAWEAVHQALPAGWRVGQPSRHPSTGVWTVSAVDERTTGRGKLPKTVTGTGADETSALRDLDDCLRGVPQPDGTAMDALRRRLRLSYVQGAEEYSREHDGRGLTAEELEGVTRRFEG